MSIGVLLALSLLVLSCNREAQDEGTAGDSVTGGVVTDTTPKTDVSSPNPLTGRLVVEDVYTIDVSDEGFSPSTLTVKVGDSVKFIAKDSTRHWPASDNHPVHSLYPGSNLNKCNGPEQESIFDACWALREGETYEFTFEEQGTWSFHDHLHPALTGMIIVE